MSSPRWLAALTIPIIASAALVSSAAVASANPTDDAYLNQLRGAGLTWPAGDDDVAIGPPVAALAREASFAIARLHRDGVRCATKVEESTRRRRLEHGGDSISLEDGRRGEQRRRAEKLAA